MSTAEDVRFEVLSNKFNAAIDAFAMNSEDERSWSLIDSRQFEIMDAMVDNTQKAQALDRVLWEIKRIHPRANNSYCKALQNRLSVTDKKNTDDLNRIAQDAFMHRRDVDIMNYGKIIYEVYKLSKDKDNFPYRDTAKFFHKKQQEQEKKVGREQREEDLRYIKYLLNDPNYDSVQKINKVEEALTILSEERYFGPIQANKDKKSFCDDAVKICREELHDTQTAEYYLDKAKTFQKRADKASLEWAKRHGEPYKALEEAYKQKYRTDGGR